MEAADFVADSDEEEQEMIDALVVAEEEFALRQALAAKSKVDEGAELAAALAGSDAGASFTPKAGGSNEAGHQEESLVVQESLPQMESPVLQEEQVVVSHPEDKRAMAPKDEANVAKHSESHSKEEGDAVFESEDGAEAPNEKAPKSALKVGEVVEVESRTWPGINKPGGSGRVVRVHTEPGENGEADQVFYDVRYVLGGFEKHIESEFVESSAILQAVHGTTRRHVPREYYHDNYINEPYLQKQREAAERRARAALEPHATPASHVQKKKRKRPRGTRTVTKSSRKSNVKTAHDGQGDEEGSDSTSSSSGEDEDEEHTGVRQIRDDMFLFTGDTSISLEVGSGPLNSKKANSLSASTAPSPTNHSRSKSSRKSSKRRRLQVLESDEEYEEESDAYDQNEVHGLNAVSKNAGHGVPEEPRQDAGRIHNSSSVRRRVDAVQRKRSRKRTHKQQRYAGGYSIGVDQDPDSIFIQPEGNPTELPEDVARETHLVLAKTKEGLKVQLEDKFEEQKRNLAKFREEKRAVDKLLERAADMPPEELNKLYRKVYELERFVEKTLIRGGEDVMNTIISRLTKKGGILADALELTIDKLNAELRTCSAWINSAQNTVENTFTRRDANLPFSEVVSGEYSSDSSEYNDPADDEDVSALPETKPPSPRTSARNDEADYSFQYDALPRPSSGRRRSQQKQLSHAQSRRPSSGEATKNKRSRKIVSSTTLDDYEFVQYSSVGQIPTDPFYTPLPRSNLRLFGKQRQITPSDPRWNWSKLARQKQQRVANGAQPNRPGSARTSRQAHTKTKHKSDDSGSVQAQRMQLRDKRYRSQATGSRAPASYAVPPSSYQAQFNTGTLAFSALSHPAQSDTRTVAFSGAPVKVSPEKSHHTVALASPMTASSQPSIPKVPLIDWETVFDVVSDGSGVGSPHKGVGPIPKEQRQRLSAFGHAIHGPTTPLHLLRAGTLGLEEDAEFDDFVVKRASCLRQLLNDLRLQEIDFMESLSSEGMTTDDSGHEDTAGWRELLNLEEEYHTAMARFVVQVVESLEEVTPSSLPNHVKVILEQVAQLLRQLPDCDSVIRGCQSYYFFFEVASRDAKSTPLLTAILRTYWYSLRLLVAVEAACDRLTVPEEPDGQAFRDAFSRILPTSRVTLASMLFLFDLYLYLPSSHYLDDTNSENEENSASSPALALWVLVYDSFTTTTTFKQLNQEVRSSNGKDFWALLQTVYRQRYFDELARCFVRSESSGGYLRDFAPRDPGSGGSGDDCDEIMGSQLLALESTWDLLAILSRCCEDPESDDTHGAISDAKWAVVKDLLQPGKTDFLPFSSTLEKTGTLPQDYLDRAGAYRQRVLERVLAFSKQWSPCREIIESIMQQLWAKVTFHRAEGDVLKLPHFLKHFLVYAKTSGTTLQSMIGFVDTELDDAPDATTMLCKIIWIQLLKLEKRVHRSRFRRFVLNAIPSTPTVPQSTKTPVKTSTEVTVPPKSSAVTWNWGKSAPGKAKPDKLPQAPVMEISAPPVGTDKERMSTSVLLTFGVVGICLECTGEESSTVRSEKDIKYLEREVEFYCKEILRWTSGKRDCEVIVAQALYVLGALLMEKRSNEYPVVFLSLNAELESSVKYLREKPPLPPIVKKPLARNKKMINKAEEEAVAREEKRRRLLQCATLSPLYLLRDLSKKLCELPSPSATRAHSVAVMNSLGFILNSGLEACLHAAIEKVIPVDDLKIALEILQFVLPKAPEDPKQCVQVTSTPNDGHNEFDESDDAIWANMDLDALSTGSIPSWSIQECRPQVLQLIMNNLRVVLQQLVLNYPPSEEDPTFEELYAVDLFGMTLSTCDVQFIWSNLTSNAVKLRNLGARVLGAALKYHPEKEWLVKSFLRDSGADQELASTWLMGTLDVSALKPTTLPFKTKDTPFSVEWNNMEAPASTAVAKKGANEARDSDYWLVLTDGIIYNILRKSTVGLFPMDPLLLKILTGVATTCKFPAQVCADPAELHEISTLYDLHLDVFQAFCKTAGSMWHTFSANPALHRQEMNQLRLKTMNQTTGIFVSFLEAYKVNFRNVFGKLDENNHEWHAFSKLFLHQAGVSALGGRSYHRMDDSIKSFDYRFTDLTTMFRFMYQCMDSFLFHCGSMAIGETNLFFDIMELLFRQVNAAEYPQATKRMARQRALDQRSGVRNTNHELRKGFSPTAVGFVNSVQLFFAQQKYPSLLHWFAQTSEIYQTFKSRWNASPLRTLMTNSLDPDGPMGIYSYYPDEQSSSDPAYEVGVASIRREAFYLSCGLFLCRGSTSFAHSRAKTTMPREAKARLGQMRAFILSDFMRETFDFAMSESQTCLHETMVPMCQFIHATLNHANLNIQEATTEVECEGSDPSEFQLRETHACMEWITECLVNSASADEAICSTLSCVLLIEFCGIMSEAVTFNDRRPFPEFIALARAMLAYLSTVYAALAKKSSHPMPDLFAHSVQLAVYSFSAPIYQNIKAEDPPAAAAPTTRRETYGINLIRARTDLLAAIRRVVQVCQKSSDERLRGAVVAS